MSTGFFCMHPYATLLHAKMPLLCICLHKYVQARRITLAETNAAEARQVQEGHEDCDHRHAASHN